MGKKPVDKELQSIVRKRTEKASQNNPDLLKTLVDIFPNPVFYKDKDGVYQGCNDVFASQILGLKKEKIIGRSLFDLPDLIPSDLSQIYHQKDHELIINPGTQVYEAQVKCADGVRRYFMFNKTTYTDARGKVAGIVGIMTDISARRRMEEVFKESEKRYKLLYERAPLGYQSLDSNGHFLEVNQAWLDTLGYTREEVIGKSFGDFLHPDWKDHFKENFPRFKAVGEVLGVEFEMVKKDGSTILVAFNGKIGRDENGEFKQTHCILHDVTSQRRSEEALRTSEKRFRSLFEQSNDAIFIHDLNNRIVDVNQRASEMVGYEKEHLIRMPVKELHPADELGSVEKSIKETRKKGYTRFESRLKKKDGTLVDVEIISRITDPEKGIVQGIIRDISKSKQAEQALREERDKAQRYLDIAGVIFVVLNADQTVALINNKGCQVTGYHEKEILGKNWFDNFLPERDREKTREGFFKLIAGDIEPNEYFENYILTKNSEERLIAWHNTVLRDEEGNITGTLSSGEDITERRLTETALQESQEKFRLMAENIAEIFWISEPNSSKLLYVSPSYEKTWQRPLEDIYKYPSAWIQSVHKDDLNRVMANMEKQAQGHITYEEFRIILPNGSIRWIANRAYPIHNENGEIVHVSGIATDITENKIAIQEKERMQTQLQQAQKMEAIGTLAGGIAHDFNNILSPIIGCTEMSLEDVSAGTFIYENLQAVLKAGMRARDLVQQILTFSRQTDQELKPLRIQNIIKEVLKLSRSTLPSTIQIQQYISNQCSLVMADETQIHQIAMNLITNAYHAMEETGGKLHVTLKEIKLAADNLKEPGMIPGPYVCLTVTDTGIGMQKSIAKRIFDPYFTTKKKEKGTGLGLSVVHGIVKEFGGHISVYSEPNQGTAFHVYLPAIKTMDEDVEIEAMEPALGGSERILLVDDEDQVLRMVKQMLERLGYQVTAKTSSIEALEVFRDAPDQFDLIITDMTMPNITGVQLSRKLLAIRSNMPIIICSGFSETIDEQKAKELGIRGYVMKPVVKRELAEKVREALDS